MPNDPWSDIDKSQEIWDSINSAPTQSSLKSPKELLAQKGYGGSDMEKYLPPTAASKGPFDNSSWFDSGLLQDPGGFKTHLKSGGNFWSNAGHMVNPFAWIAPVMGELLAPQNPTNSKSIQANINDPYQADPNSPTYNPTMLNLPSRLASSVIPHPMDLAKTAYSRGEHGQTTGDLYAIPATMAALMAAPKVGRAILPKDIAAETAQRAARAATGSEAKSFTHGATPDTAMLQDLKGGLTTRSQGRLLTKIKATKEAELSGLEKDLDVPAHQTNVSNPLESIKPVLDDAASRAVPSELVKLEEFRNLLTHKINTLSSGTMKLNPAQLVQLKRWVDGFVGVYRDEPVGTVKDLAQNTYSAIRKHLDGVAPEATIRSQRIQSLIQAEEDLHKKIYTPTPRAHTELGELKNMLSSVAPTTLMETGTAALFKMLSGDTFAKPILPGNLGIPDLPPDPTAPPPEIAGALDPPPQRLLGPARLTITPRGAVIPPDSSNTGMVGGLPEAPRVLGGSPASRSGAPTSTDPYNAAINAGKEYLGELNSKNAASGTNWEETWKQNAATRSANPNMAMVAEDLQKAHDLMSRNGVKPPDALLRVLSKLDRSMPEEAPTAAPAQTTNQPMEIPPKPTHLAEGAQVSGMDQSGNLIAGKLERLYPVIHEGAPTWMGTVLDIRNGRTLDLPAQQLFDRLAGPPKSGVSVAVKPTKSAPPPEVSDWLDKLHLRQLEEDMGAGKKPPKPRKK